jgi:hypothetical protein
LETVFDLDPTFNAVCPVCKNRLSLGPVDKRGRDMRPHPAHQWVVPAQTAICLECRRSFVRHQCGKEWTSWREADSAEAGAIESIRELTPSPSPHTPH